MGKFFCQLLCRQSCKRVENRQGKKKIWGEYSYRFADTVGTLAYSRNAAVGIMAGKENFRLDMEAGDACVCAGYFRQSVPAAFGRIKVG